MKRIILTESQYKRLVSQPLNESIIFEDGYSLNDVSNVNIINILISLSGNLWYDYKQNLYIKSIDEDKVVIDLEKYDEEVKEYIKKTMDMFLIISDNSGDSIDDKGNIDFSFDTEPVDGETVVDDLAIRQKIVTKSESRLGEPYEFGDEFDEVGGDCSGLIDWVLRNTDGIDSPYNGRETSANLKTLVKPSNKKKKIGLNKGDILVFNKLKGEDSGHVGFVHKVTDGKVDMIHSSGSKGVNITKDIFNNSFWSVSRYYGAIPIVDGKYESN